MDLQELVARLTALNEEIGHRGITPPPGGPTLAADQQYRAAQRQLMAIHASLNAAAATAGFSFIGECREKTPFSGIMVVYENGQRVETCSHDPPHEHDRGNR